MAAEFDERLKQRLIAFQQHHGLAADGVAGQTTWTTLASATPAGTRQETSATAAATMTCGCAEDAQPGQASEQPADGEPAELAGVIFEDAGAEEGVDEYAEEEDAAGDAIALQARPRRPNRRQPQPRRRRDAPPPPKGCRRDAKACFSISQRRAWLLRPGGGVVAVVPALGGRPGHETPTGQFSVQFRHRDHVSSIYHAPMPFYVNFAPAVGFHAGSLRVRSHGCVHLSSENAERFFNYLRKDDLVDVVQ